MSGFLPPPPTSNPDKNSYIWQDWYRQLQGYLSSAGSLGWELIDLTDSDINDLAGTPLLVTGGGTGRTSSLTAYGLVAAGTTATGALQTLDTGSSGQILRSGGASALPAWSTATYPNVATTTGTFLRADGTNWGASTLVLPNAATANYIPYATGTNTWGESVKLQFDGSIFYLNSSGASVTAGLAGTLLHIANAASSSARIMMDSIATNSNLTFRHASGTWASKTASATDNSLGFVGATGYGSTGYRSSAAVGIGYYAAETWTDAAQGTYQAFFTTPTASTTQTERMRLMSTGALIMGHTADVSANTDTLQVHTGSGYSRIGAYGWSTTTTDAGALYLGRSHNATIGTHGLVAAGTRLGIVAFWGSDGVQWRVPSAIMGEMDDSLGATSGSADVPGRLAFYTSPDGAASLTERVRITNAGAVGIARSTTGFSTTFTTTRLPSSGADTALYVYSDTNTRVLVDAAGAVSPVVTMRRAAGTWASPTALQANDAMGSLNWFGRGSTAYSAGSRAAIAAYASATWTDATQDTYITFWTTPNASTTVTERMRLLANGSLVIGHTADSGPQNEKLQVHTGSADSLMSATSWSTTTTHSGRINLGHSNNNTIGTHGLVAAGTRLGAVVFYGSDGVTWRAPAAIFGEMDDTLSVTSGSGDTPGRITFWTSPDAAATVSERMRITNQGQLFVNRGNTTVMSTAYTAARMPGINVDTAVYVYSADSSSTRILVDSWGTGAAPILNGRLARGTAASPTAVQTDDQLLVVAGGGYGSTAYVSGAKGGLWIHAAAAWTDSASSTYLRFITTPAASTTATERMRLLSTGQLLIGHTADVGISTADKLQVHTSANHAGIGAFAWSTTASEGGYLSFGASRSATIGTHTLVAAGGRLGTIGFYGADGSGSWRGAAFITGNADDLLGVATASGDMPGQIMFWTTPDGSTSSTERMRLTSNGQLLIKHRNTAAFTTLFTTTRMSMFGSGTASTLYVAGTDAVLNAIVMDTFGANQGLYFRRSEGTGASPTALTIDKTLGTVAATGYGSTAYASAARAYMTMLSSEAWTDAAQGTYIVWGTTANTTTTTAERMRLLNSGVLVLGHTAAVSRLSAELVEVNVSGGGGYAMGGWSATAATAPLLTFSRSKSATIGTQSVVASGDALGYISFRGSDGSAFQYAAQIVAEVDGTPGSGDMPGRLLFRTTPDGTSSVVEQMRITNAGDIAMKSAAKFYFDGVAATGNTYVTEVSADILDIYAGGTNILELSTTYAAIPKTKGTGFKVDTTTPTFPWHDLLGAVSIRGVGASDPSYNVYQGGIRGYQFDPSEECFIEFHIPHDYVPASHVYLHFHWSLNGTTTTGSAAGTVTGGTVTWGAEVSYAKGHNQAAFSSPVTTTVASGTTASTLYQHYITEVQLSATTPSGSQIDSDDLEVDGVILVRVYLSSNDITVSSGSVPDPFLHYVDLHYQSTGIGTKAKVPDFWT